ncbi:MAG: hypothetical protein JWM80_6078 [Cyanobacteria bacterium RYN_339]|nr:hypothetical protein [Cyanobacteria bacterium RYN_339]
MSDRSIRSFALDYYRKRGAEIRELADEAFEIQEAQGAALKVTFAHEAEAPLTATSPQWRAILEDLTADVAVSYRYLAAGAIARPARTLEAAMPEGWAVSSAKLLDAENRVAVGLTHRVTFDSPALNACTEVIHHHLWDVNEERRLTSFESKLYDLPCIMIRPERLPDEATVQGLLGRSLAAVDEASDARGREIERELAEMLSEAEKRTNQYFEQQLGNVLQREVQLAEKLDGTIRRMAEARTPEAVARYRQDGESLARQLEYARANREAELGTVESACHAKLGQERDKHELTATTDLVALCHASYDVLTYRATVTSPDGFEANWVLRYWPVSGELQLPACQACGHALVAPVSIAGGGFACGACVAACKGCGTRSLGLTGAPCDVCAGATCTGCETRCTHCDAVSCTEHAQGCATCEAAVCVRCASHCHACNEALCQHHARLDVHSGRTACDRHVPIEAPRPAPRAIEKTVPAPRPATVMLAAAVLGERAEPTDSSLADLLAAAENSGVEHLFVRPDPVYSVLSGRAMHPKLAETCPCCQGQFAVQEMVDCPTCCTPSCLTCSQGEAGPCPACDALAPAEADDEHLALVFAQFPELARGRRRWEIAVQGPYVLAHWSRLGTWGMVVYHQADQCVLTAFAFGRMETVRQTLKGWWAS